MKQLKEALEKTQQQIAELETHKIMAADMSARQHQDHAAPRGTHSIYVYGLIHAPISNYHQIPEAREALNREWEKLEKMPAWDCKQVRSKAEVKAEAIKSKKTIHFAQLMALCFLKNAELEKGLQKYKGRVVLRGSGLRTNMVSSHLH